MTTAAISLQSTDAPQYWRSLDQLSDTPEFRRYVENEFPSRAGELIDPLSRRRFVQVMGASLAMAGLSGCDMIRWPKEKILPFAARPANRDPGTTVEYASSIELGGVGLGLVVTSYDGRPIKIEGNAMHPGSLGATDAFTQASVLDMYDPDRSQSVAKISPAPAESRPPSSSWSDPNPVTIEPSTWESFEAFAKDHFEALKGKGGEGLAVLTCATSSPTMQRMKKKLAAAMPKALWCEWEPLSFDAAREGSVLALGKAHRVSYALSSARVVVSLDADLLHHFPNAVRHARDFAGQRRPEKGAKLNRLWVIESAHTVTGTQADHRLALPASHIESFGLALAAELAGMDGVAAETKTKLALHALKADDPRRGFVQKLAQDLLGARGAGVIAVGPAQPPRLHALALYLNQLLGSVGKTVFLTEDPDADRPAHAASLAALVAAKPATLVVLGSNPIHAAPADLKFADFYSAVATRIHLGTMVDETARASTWHLPQAHYLESWGDTRGHDGTVSPIQPLIAPLYGNRTAPEVLAIVLGDSKNQRKGYEIVRSTFQQLTGMNTPETSVAFETAWRKVLHDGVLPASATPFSQAAVNPAGILAALPAPSVPAAPTREQLELRFTPDNHVWDGRFANNAWLQELPDQLTKLTWDNALLVSPYTAAQLGVAGDDLVTLTVGAASLTVPIYVLPGIPAFCATLSVGYGRLDAAGVVGRRTGFDAYPLRTQANAWSAPCTIATTEKKYTLATTQDHHSVDTRIGNEEIHERVFGEKMPGAAPDRNNYLAPLFREATVGENQKNPRFAKVIVGPDPSTQQMWGAPIDYSKGYQWGMMLDLSTCTGCSACVVACMAENNVPVVGKSEVIRGREMHWIRIDRYFRGDPMSDGGFAPVAAPTPAPGAGVETPAPAAREWAPRPLQVVHQPINCQQCENAPCEAVCPVGATTHSEEGLNDMAYNRCIGTRYCANNCPYKVRRFNWFWNHHGPFHPRSEPITIGKDETGKDRVASELPVPAILEPPLKPVEKMAMNPDVTVRSRGVMEKCTYCVQRIKKVTIKARNQNRKVKDGEIVTACQQACPSDAIVFGDLNDETTRVSQLQALDRSYMLLAELNTRPRTQFLGKLRNPVLEA